MISLYIHIPFCHRICSYCDFSVLVSPRRLHREYIQLLLREATLRGAEIDWHCPHTVYFGGGTPSLLHVEEVQDLGQGLSALGMLQNMSECSVEFNPEHCQETAIQAWLDLGANRASLGIQTLQDDLLQQVRRVHTAQQALLSLQTLQQAFPSVTADLMFGLPHQSLQQFDGDLQQILDQGIQHVSLYGLTLEPQTLLFQQMQREPEILEKEDYAEFYQQGIALASRYGLERYEISNAAVPGQESRHNQHYWNRGQYLGLGPGAHSFLQGKRLGNPRHYQKWKQWVLAQCPLQGQEIDVLDQQAELVEWLWLGLRQSRGIPAADFLSRMPSPKGKALLEKYQAKGWLELVQGNVRVQGQGWVMHDTLICDILADMDD